MLVVVIVVVIVVDVFVAEAVVCDCWRGSYCLCLVASAAVVDSDCPCC